MPSPSPWFVDRVDATLLVIDMQERLAAAMPDRASVISHVALLVNAAHLLDVPVLVTRQNPTGLGDTVPELLEVLGEYEPVDKMAFCCRSDEGFSAALADTWRGQVVIAGMETHICVAQTALALLEDGYRVHVVADATCSRRALDYRSALDRLRFAGVAVTTTEAVLYEMLGEAGTEEFREVLAMVKQHDALDSEPNGVHTNG